MGIGQGRQQHSAVHEREIYVGNVRKRIQDGKRRSGAIGIIFRGGSARLRKGGAVRGVGGGRVSMPDRVEALFEVVMFLVTYTVDKITLVGRGARERSGDCWGRYLHLVAKEAREFHAMQRNKARGQCFQSSFVR